MRKILSTLVLTLLVVLLVACGSTTYTVTFNTSGGDTETFTVETKGGRLISRPTNPKKEGFIFEDWYLDQSFSQLWRFNSYPVNENLTLYAKWSEEGSNSGNLEIAPGVIPINDIYGSRTVSEWKSTYSSLIDVDEDGNGIPDWQEKQITLTWAANKGDIGDNPMNNLLWRHAKSFEEKYPNIKVVRDERFMSSVNDLDALELFKVASQEGTMPDIFYSPLSAELYDADLTLDLFPYYRTDVEAAYISQNIMDFNKSFDGNEMVTAAYRTVATKVLSLNVGLLKEYNIPVPSYDWTYAEYEALRNQVGALTDAKQAIFPGFFNFSEIGPRYFDGIPGGWKGYNIETQQFELSNALNFGNWLEEQASESARGWHFYDLTREEQQAIAGNITGAYTENIQVMDSSRRFWEISTLIVKDYIMNRGLEIELYSIPIAPDGGDTVQYGYADTYALGYHLANDPVKAQAAYELMRYLSFSEEGMEVRYNFLWEDIETYGETPDEWEAAGNNPVDWPVRHPYRDIIAYVEGFPATSNPRVIEKYPLVVGFDENSYYKYHNFGAFQNEEFIRQLSNIVIFPRNLPAFNNAQGALDPWKIRDDIRDRGYTYGDVIANYDTSLNELLDEFRKNYSKLNK